MEPTNLERTLYQVRAMLWANALHRTWGRRPNRGVSIAQLAPEAASLRARVAARINLAPAEEAKEIKDLLPLPTLRANPATIPMLAELVLAGEVTLDEIERFMLTSEYSGQSWRGPRELDSAAAS